MTVIRCEDCKNKNTTECATCRVEDGLFAIPESFEPTLKKGKHPMGIMPRYITDELRFTDLQSAIIRYAAVGAPIPSSWLTEYNELSKRLVEVSK